MVGRVRDPRVLEREGALQREAEKDNREL